MIVIKILGGLGNQMFQYALYRELGKRFEKSYGTRFVRADTNSFLNYRLHSGYELERVFRLEPNRLSIPAGAILRIAKKAGMRSGLAARIFPVRFIDEVDDPDGEIFEMVRKNHVYLTGYWQSEYYFSNVRDEIRRDFRFDISTMSHRNMQSLRRIEGENSVSLHVRRGDYISNKENYEYLGFVCNNGFYQDAVDYIYARHPEAAFFVFSDDIEYCRNTLRFHGRDVDYINWNRGGDSFWDLFLMSRCRHNIISNSSFSWWGAWLNENPEKIVVTPGLWRRDDYNLRRIPDAWVRMKIRYK